MVNFRQLKHNEIENFSSNREIILFVEPIGSPENIAGIFRAAEAMGVSEIYWKDQLMDLNSKKIVKISRNTNQKVQFHKVEEYTVLDDLREKGYNISALELTTNAQNIYQTTFSNKIVLIIGNESSGVSKIALSKCDQVFFIPMYGQNSSMNLVVSLGIALSKIMNS